ncbi:MAG: endopeptidase La [Thermotogae bacterium]|jgi:ATP-dependent Lon protease|nr:endopeptidase La [Thermotogota bacterium]MCL5032130.1 endopeptidase La [Thermotogota bacterium]
MDGTAKYKEKVAIPPEELPCVPLKGNDVAFPTALVPFHVERESAIKALDKVVENEERYLILVSQKNQNVQIPDAGDLYGIGTFSRLLQLVKLPDGSIRALAEGIIRVKITEYTQKDPFLLCKYEALEKKVRKSKDLTAVIRLLKSKAMKYFDMTKRLPEDAVSELALIDEPDKLVDTIISFTEMSLENKQRFLELVDPRDRMIEFLKYLNSEIAFLKIEADIDDKVKEKIDKGQKEFYLREKMETIKNELGDDISETDELREKLKRKKYPTEVKRTIEKEINRFEKMYPASPEATVSRNYIDWLFDIPWYEKTKEDVNVKRASKVLEADHYGLEDVKDRILDYIAIKNFSSTAKSPILCLVGPPGVGKTSLGMSLAKALNRKFVQISLGGMRDEAEIRGHRRTYIGALPGRLIQTIVKVGVKNPVILLDEIDKMGISFQGDPAAALLEVLDPEENSHFIDNYVEIPFDLSDVVFVTTANTVEPIPPALADRMEIIEIPGYTFQEKIEISKRFLIPKLRKEYGMEGINLEIKDEAVQKMIEDYTLESGVRSLERIISKLLRKIARNAMNNDDKITIRSKEIEEMLGAPMLVRSQTPAIPTIGETIGLAWTPAGGEVLVIEATAVPGTSQTLITGNLGNVMKESVTIAMTLCKDLCQEKAEFFKTHDFHIHAPEGAIPKDGPSAGVAILTSLCSVVTGKPVRNDVAMTGEITLNGKVLAIGGLREKLLAAKRFGIKEVIVPKANEPMVKKMKADVIADIKINYVEDVSEALKIDLGIDHVR